MEFNNSCTFSYRLIPSILLSSQSSLRRPELDAMCDAEEYASLFFEKFLKEIIKSTNGVMRFDILLSKY